MRSIPGIYPDVPAREYHATPAVNARLLATIVDRCPGAAWFESWLNPERPPDESSATMNAGTIAHAILLEGGCSRVAVIDPNDHPAKTTGAIPEGWTNQSIRLARDNAILAGKIPILKSQFAAVEEMVAVAQEFIGKAQRDEPAIHAAFQDGGGESEVSMLWDDNGILCRIRPDRINRARTLVVDYKTTDATSEPNAWGRGQMFRLNFDMGAAFYRRGVDALCHVRPDYVFLVQEQFRPYLCSLVGIDPQSFDLGEAKIEYALDLWRKCVRAERWPDYPARVCYPTLPPWEQAQWEERESIGHVYDPAKLYDGAIPGKKYANEKDPAA